MEDKKKKRQIAKISVFITSIFVIFMSVTYAFITQTLTGTKEVVINAGVLDLVLEEENAITISNALPMYDAVGMIQEDVFKFRLVNKTNNPTNYVLKLQEIETGTLDKSIVKYGLIKEGEKTIDLVSNIMNDVIDEGTITGNDIIDYELRLWIDSSVTNLAQVQSKFLSFKIAASASQEIVKVSFTDELENKVQESTSTFPDFKFPSSETNGRGIYKYQEDGEDIYYWRGKVDEVEGAANHVIFGGFCWEIVRTTKTGGVKMIYDGTPVEVDGKQTCPNTGTASQLSSTSAFNSSDSDNAYVGYMYGLTGVSEELSSPQCIKLNSTGTKAEVGTETSKAECVQVGGKWATTAYEATHANVVNSTIKGVIDEWFGTSSLNTKENLEKLEDAVYCNDRSLDTVSGYGNGLGYGKNQTAYMPRYRIDRKGQNPSLECTNINDRFTTIKENGNGDLTYPVGLLTTDEIALAGAVLDDAYLDSDNNDYYLYTGEDYWTISPSYFYTMSGEFYVKDTGSFYSFPFLWYGVRPAISLAAGTAFAAGTTGTVSNPYVVE